jgi:hypothetical protein
MTHFDMRFMTLLFGEPIHFQITLRSDSKRVGHSIEKGKHRCDVDRFSDLRFGPTVIAQLLHVLIGSAIGRFCHLGHVFKQCPFSGV